MMKAETFAELAGYGYPEGVRPRSVLGQVVDTVRAIGAGVSALCVLLCVAAAVLAPYLMEAALDAAFEVWDSLPPTTEVEMEGGAR